MDLCWFGMMSGRLVTPAAVPALGWLQTTWRIVNWHWTCLGLRRSPLLRRSFTTFHKVSSFEVNFYANINFQPSMAVVGMDEKANLMGVQTWDFHINLCIASRCKELINIYIYLFTSKYWIDMVFCQVKLLLILRTRVRSSKNTRISETKWSK